MYCPNCGKQNDDDTSFCIQCGKPLPRPGDYPSPQPTPIYQTQVPVTVPNYLVTAILVTIFSCLPLGIPAIVYAAQANAKAAQGDFSGAKAASVTALTWCWVSFGVGLVFGVLCLVCEALLGFAVILAGIQIGR